MAPPTPPPPPPPPPPGFEDQAVAPPPPPGFDDQAVAPPPPTGFEQQDMTQVDVSEDESIESDTVEIEDNEIDVSDSLSALDAPTVDEDDWEESSDIEESLNAISDVESQPTPSQSSSIRPATEVDTIPGDKLHATLSEVEQCTVNPDGSIRSQTI